MDIEFHYSMTYLIAARAGFAPAASLTIAHAAQGVDDNHIRYRVTGAPDGDYFNYVSQTLDILKPASQLLRIYPIFHFIPGDPTAETARRADARQDAWVTTPDSAVAGRMIDSALASGDLYRIGVAAHGYVDTWAHQNFLGRRDALNDLPGAPWIDTLLNVGHGAAGHQPDHPALVWTDPRLAAPCVDNRGRFLDAAEALYRRFALHCDPTRREASLAAEAAALRADLDQDIGPADPSSDPGLRAARLARYQQRALQPAYGATALPAYQEYVWFNAAVAETGAALRQKLDDLLSIADDYLDQTTEIPCSWRDPAAYVGSDWFRFVEAVKAHQNACWDILVAENLPGLDAQGM
jgi:hypothetical protein